MQTAEQIAARQLAKLRKREKVFWEKVNKNGPIPEHNQSLGPCWIWLGSKDNQGYGRFKMPNGKEYLAHRYSFELAKGLYQFATEPDHLCRVRGCINPDHLEAVTHKVNALRGEGVGAKNARRTHCKKGHPLTEGYGSEKQRRCRICRRESINNAAKIRRAKLKCQKEEA